MIELTQRCVIENIIANAIRNNKCINPLNIRGEYSSGKSTFLGLFYIHLLLQYSRGEIDFIPAYFHLENLENAGSMHSAVEHNFKAFINRVEEIAHKEHQPICYIIDGLDEQDCWSFGSEASIGKVLMDILCARPSVYYIMSFSQHRLPRFKNTISSRKYNDKSDVMYFNPVDVTAENDTDLRFFTFVDAFFGTENKVNSQADVYVKKTGTIGDSVIDLEMSNGVDYFSVSAREYGLSDSSIIVSGTDDNLIIKMQCNLIRKFRHPTIDPDFLNRNYDFITSRNDASDGTVRLLNGDASVAAIQHYNIDFLHEMCLCELGYNFEEYAAPMAFLFSYKGYTYEKFKLMAKTGVTQPIQAIYEDNRKIYNTFRFIKKHRDARAYLVALQYNRELRYYAENSRSVIEEESILNEFLSRDIALFVRLIWQDTNEFVIVYKKLLERKGAFLLNNCTYSMLTYILAHQRLYKPIRDKLKKQMDSHCSLLLQNNKKWHINEDQASDDKLAQFMDLSLKHTLETFNSMDARDSVALVDKLLSDKDFRLYNRQYQMLYYGDLSIRGEDTKHALYPGKDTIYKGMDFHNCFYYLYNKIMADGAYPLREYDLFTLFDLLCSRLQEKNITSSLGKCLTPDSFFYGITYKDQAAKLLKSVTEIYVFKIEFSEKQDLDNPVHKYFRQVKNLLSEAYRLCEIKKSLTGAEYNVATLNMYKEVMRWVNNPDYTFSEERAKEET